MQNDVTINVFFCIYFSFATASPFESQLAIWLCGMICSERKCSTASSCKPRNKSTTEDRERERSETFWLGILHALENSWLIVLQIVFHLGAGCGLKELFDFLVKALFTVTTNAVLSFQRYTYSKESKDSPITVLGDAMIPVKLDQEADKV